MNPKSTTTRGDIDKHIFTGWVRQEERWKIVLFYAELPLHMF